MIRRNKHEWSSRQQTRRLTYTKQMEGGDSSRPPTRQGGESKQTQRF